MHEDYLSRLDKENYCYHWANGNNVDRFLKASYELCKEEHGTIARGKSPHSQVLMRLPVGLHAQDEVEKHIFNKTWEGLCRDIASSTLFPKILNHGVDLAQFEEFELTIEKPRQSIMQQEYGEGMKLVLEIALNKKVATFLFRHYLLGILLSADLIDKYIINHYKLYETAFRKYINVSESRGVLQLGKFDLTPLYNHEILGPILKGLVHAKGVING